MSQLSRLLTRRIPLPLVLLVVLAACGDSPKTPTPVAKPVNPAPTPVTMKNKTAFVRATDADVESFDPAWAGAPDPGVEAAFNVYERLVFWNRDKSTEYVPALATKWVAADSDHTYVFTIRSGVKFHAGQDLTPEDVAYSLWRAMIQDRTGGSQAGLLQAFFGLGVQSFAGDVVDQQFTKNWPAACGAVKQAVTYDNAAGTVTLHLKQPYEPLLAVLADTPASIVSKSWVIDRGGWNGDCAFADHFNNPAAGVDELSHAMNGTGPYKLLRWTPGTELVLARNKDYWSKTALWPGGPAGVPSIDQVVIKFIKDGMARFALFQRGELDDAQLLPQSAGQLSTMVKEICAYDSGTCTSVNPNGFLRRYTHLPVAAAGSVNAILFNQQINTQNNNPHVGSGKLDGNGIPPEFFADLHVRKAFNECFNWTAQIETLWQRNGEQLVGPIPPGMLGYNPNQAHYAFDSAQCAAEFHASTLHSPAGKSLWDTGFVLQYVYIAGDPTATATGGLLKQGLAAVNPHFKLELVSVPAELFQQDLQARRLPLAQVTWTGKDPHAMVLPVLGSAGRFTRTQHFAAATQTQLDTLITSGVTTADPAARATIYGQLQNLAYEQALDLFLSNPRVTIGLNVLPLWIKGWYPNANYPGYYYYALTKAMP